MVSRDGGREHSILAEVEYVSGVESLFVCSILCIHYIVLPPSICFCLDGIEAPVTLKLLSSSLNTPLQNGLGN